MSRRQFLRGDFTGRRSPARPPWAGTEREFTDTCTRCGECLRACPEDIIRNGIGGYPEVDFTRGECTFCARCVTSCDTGALSRDRAAPDGGPWSLRATVGDACLARQYVVCCTCGELCPQEAIGFAPAAGGSLRPSVDAGLCTGCGACVAPCPVRAIEVRA